MASDQVDIGKLEVSVIEAKNLMQADRFSQSDPYVVVTFGDESRSTYSLNNTNNPVWKKQEPFYFEVRSRKAKLFIDVFDKNKVEKDVFLGQVEISLSELEGGANRDNWWPLRDHLAGVGSSTDAPKKGKDITGSIHLKIEYTYSRLAEIAAGFLNEDIDVYAAKGEVKAADFSMSVLIANITVLYGLLEPVINFYYRQMDYWYWTDASASITMFFVYSFVSLNNWLIPTLIPLYLLAYMTWNYIEVGGKLTKADDDDYTYAIQEGEEKVDMGFLGISYYTSQLQVVQNSVGDTNLFIQNQKDLFNWRYPETTWYIWYGVAILTVLWTFIPFRFVMFTITLYLFTRYTRFYTWSWRVYKGVYKLIVARYGREAQVKRRGFEAADRVKSLSASSKNLGKAKAKAKAKKTIISQRSTSPAVAAAPTSSSAAAAPASSSAPASPASPASSRKHKHKHKHKHRRKSSKHHQ